MGKNQTSTHLSWMSRGYHGWSIDGESQPEARSGAVFLDAGRGAARVNEKSAI
jgi:hypothetical protein